MQDGCNNKFGGTGAMRTWEGWSNATAECDTTVVDAAMEAKVGTCADKWCMTFMYKVHPHLHSHHCQLAGQRQCD